MTGEPAGGQPPSATHACRACRNPTRDSARFCPVCGASQHPLAEVRARRTLQEGRWRSVRRSIIFYAVLLGVALPLFWMPESLKVKGLMVASVIDALIVLVYHRISGVALRPMLGTGPAVSRWSVAGMVLLVPLLALNLGYHRLLVSVLGNEDFVVNLTEVFRGEPGGLWIALGTICLMPAVWEEIAFRGLLQTELTAAVGAGEGLLLTAIFFATIHAAFLSWPYLFLLGLVLGWLRRRSGSLVPGMVAHFLHNLAILIAERL